MPARIALGFRPDRSGPAGADYVFAAVLAEVHDGEFMPTAPSRFPPRGTIHVGHSLFPSTFEPYDLGFWDCEESSLYIDKGQGSQFHAVRRRSDLPAELIALDYPSHHQTAVRDRLLHDGLTCPFGVEGRDILLEFTDRVVAGPVRFKRTAAAGPVVSETPAVLDRPLPAWTSRSSLQPVNLHIGMANRWFVWPVPKSERYVHFMSTEQMLRTLLRIGSHRGPGTYLLTDAQRNEIVQRLAEIDDPSRVPPMFRQHLQGLLDESLKTGKQLDVWVHLLLEDPDVQRQLEEHKQQVAAQALHDLQQREAGLLQRIGALQTQESILTDNLESLKKACSEEEARKEEAAAKVTATIIARARQAQQDVSALLAEVAVLRPFLGNADAAAPTPSAVPALTVEKHQEDVRRLGSLDDAARVLQLALVRVGLQTVPARALSREILVAATLGQALFFQGSLARPLARAVAGSLVGANWTRLELPVGVFRSDGVHEVITSATDPAGKCSALLIDGVNRSCIDAYGQELIDVLSERSLSLNCRAPGLLILGTLSEGASALQPTPDLTALGPTWHTDYLHWTKPSLAATDTRGHLLTWKWPHPDADQDRDVAELLDVLCGVPNELWRRHVLGAFHRLAGWPSKDTAPSALEGILFAWVLPRCLACGIDVKAHVELLRGHFADPAKLESRLKRLLFACGVEFAS